MPDQTLAQRIRAKYPGVYDDLADIELEEKVSAKFPGTYDDIPRTQATLTRERPAAGAPSALDAGHHPDSMVGGPAGAREIFGKRVPSIHELGPDDVPSDAAFLKRGPQVGAAIASGLTGGLAAIPMAALGGAGGAVARQQFQKGLHAPTVDEAKEAATEGAWEGGTQAVGMGIGRGLDRAGRIIYGKAINANPSLVKQFGPGSRDAMARAGIEEGIVPGTRSAASRAEASAIRSGADARQVLNASPAAHANARVKMPAVAKGLDRLRAEVANRPTANVSNDAINQFEADFLASHPDPKSLDALLTLKQGAQQEASTAYRAATADRMSTLNAEANEAIAKEAQRILESAAPATKALNFKTKSRIGLTRALEDEQARNHALTALISGAAGVGTGFTTGDPAKGFGAAATAMALRDPRVLGSLGIALAKVGGETAEQAWANIFRAMRSAAQEPDENGGLSEPVNAPLRDAAGAASPAKVPIPLRGQSPQGQVEPGNIDLDRRPVVKNGDDTISTVRSMSINMDGREVLIPTVSDDGRVLSDEDAVALFERTGRHLGVFDSPAAATAYAEQLHNSQARQYARTPPLRRP
jgi:hypothetical protein